MLKDIELAMNSLRRELRTDDYDLDPEEIEILNKIELRKTVWLIHFYDKKDGRKHLATVDYEYDVISLYKEIPPKCFGGEGAE